MGGSSRIDISLVVDDARLRAARPTPRSRIDLRLRGVALASAVGLSSLLGGCPPESPGPDAPVPDVVIASPTPVRRLTTGELNHTLRDLFPGIALAPVLLTEDPGRAFAQEATTQVVSDLAVEELRAGVNDVAAAVATVVATDPLVLLPRAFTGTANDDRAVVDDWLGSFLPRAFRRDVADDERAAFVDFFATRAALDNNAVALQLVLQAILQSPAFQYRLELDALGARDALGRLPVSSVEMASRLSYFLWGTMPDDALLQAGISGVLATPEGLKAEAARLLADPRANDALRDFHRQWLDLDRVLKTNKDPARFPQYNEFLRTAMRREADLFIEHVYAEDPTLRALLTSRTTRLLPGLGPVYGVNVPEDDAVVELPPERSGILTQAQFLASRAHAVEGSPVLRGVFVLERLLCQTPPPPSGNIDITPPSADEPGALLTNRARYQAHEDNPSCTSCHRPIDGIGFGLEGFDAIGQFRTTDGGEPVDTSGSLDATRVGGTFQGAVELGAVLAESPVVAECVARHWFRFATGRREGDADETDLVDLVGGLDASDGDLRALLLDVVLTDAFRTRHDGGAR